MRTETMRTETMRTETMRTETMRTETKTKTEMKTKTETKAKMKTFRRLRNWRIRPYKDFTANGRDCKSYRRQRQIEKMSYIRHHLVEIFPP
jgi:hypothetical protein